MRFSASSRAGGRLAAGAALLTALAFGGYGVSRGTWAVGGSDSSCFALMAEAFASGSLQPRAPLAAVAPWADASLTFAPAGFVPSARDREAAAPICAPGYSLLLAPWRLAGRDAIFVVTPLWGALLVWIAYLLGRSLAGPGAGVAAALTTATTPAALFQVTQPMNDITVGCAWLAVIAASRLPDPSRSWSMGALIGLATLVRPNLAPASIAATIWFLVSLRRSGRADARRRLCGFLLAAMPFAAVLFVLNHQLYGHAFSTGYGDPRTLFSLANVPINVRQYGTALLDTQLGLPLLGVCALAIRRDRTTVTLALAVAAAVTGVYLLYQPFPEWWYLRFLLPATVPLTVIATAAGAHLLRSSVSSMGVKALIAVIVVGLLAGHGLTVAEDRQVFDLQRLEARFRRSGDVVRERTPVNAIFVTVWHSGTVRYHAGRPSVLWDSLAPTEFEPAVRWLRDQGFEPYLIVEQWEEPLFRERFSAHSNLGHLDWPPRFEVLRRVRIYRLGDRDHFLGGVRIPTEFVFR